MVVSESDTSQGDCDREEFVAEHVDSGNADRLGDELKLT
jgi:hypothetical protein